MRYLFVVLTLLFMLRCETIVDVNIETHPAELVVTSLFTPEAPWRVLVQRTVATQEVASIFPYTVDNATVTVRGDDGSLVTLHHKGGGFYHAGHAQPRAGITYTLQVQADGFGTVEAVDRLPTPVVITDVRTWSTPDRESMRIEIDIQDDGRGRNFYELYIVDDSSVSPEPFTVRNLELDTQIKALEPSDFTEPEINTPLTDRALIHDGPFDGKKFTFQLGIYGYGRDKTVYIRTVSENYYEYYRTRTIQYITENDPFTEPVMIRSNIEDGHGVFAGYIQHTYGNLSHQWLLAEVSALWSAASFRVVYDNNSDKEDTDYIADGGAVVITLYSDYTVTGHMQLSETVPIISLDGGFSMQFGRVRLFHSSDTALRDMEFHFDPVEMELSGELNNRENRTAPHIFIDLVKTMNG